MSGELGAARRRRQRLTPAQERRLQRTLQLAFLVALSAVTAVLIYKALQVP